VQLHNHRGATDPTGERRPLSPAPIRPGRGANAVLRSEVTV